MKDHNLSFRKIYWGLVSAADESLYVELNKDKQQRLADVFLMFSGALRRKMYESVDPHITPAATSTAASGLLTFIQRKNSSIGRSLIHLLTQHIYF